MQSVPKGQLQLCNRSSRPTLLHTHFSRKPTPCCLHHGCRGITDAAVTLGHCAWQPLAAVP